MAKRTPKRRRSSVAAPVRPRSLRERLEEAEQTLQAIRSGQVDAIVVGGPQGDRVFTLTGADHDYRVLMDEMSEGVATLAQDGVISYCNLRFASMVGLPPERIVGTDIRGIVPADAAYRVGALLRAGLVAVTKGEFELERPDGTAVTVQLGVSKVQMDAGFMLCVIATDLTDEKRREKSMAAERAAREAELRASEERYRGIVETAVEGIWLVDAEGNTTFANGALSEMLGYSPAELRGRTLFEFMDEESAAAARRFLARGRRYREMREFRLRARDGRELWAVLSMSPIGHEGDSRMVPVTMQNQERLLDPPAPVVDPNAPPPPSAAPT